MTNLVEIDLLRGGNPLPVPAPVKAPVKAIERQGCYSILVSRSDWRPRAELYEFDLRQRIPASARPLKPADGSIVVDLQTLLAGVYRRAKYHLAIDYSQPIRPALIPEGKAWVGALLDSKIAPKEEQPL